MTENLKNELQEKYIREGFWKQETFYKALARIADKYPDNTAVCDSETSITYKEWQKMADNGAEFLYSAGIRRGDRVIVQLPNSVKFAVIVFAVFRLGAIPIFALPAHRKSEISSFIKVAQPTGYIVPKSHLGFSYGDMAEECVSGTDCRLFFADKLDFSKSMNISIPDDEPDSAFRDIAVLQVSGGTTAIPKLIPRTHADYLYDAGVFAEVCGMNENTVFLASISASHNFTFANPGIIGTMLNGGKTVMSKTGSPDEILELIEEHKVTITAIVPSLLALCSEMAEWEETELDSLKTILVGGSLLTEPVLMSAESAFNCKVRQVYGTAEGLNCITDENMTAEQTACCQGKPISSGDEMCIESANGGFAPANTEGELLLRGPYTIQNYYNNPEADMVSFREDGFYRTGDCAFIDEDGNLHITGRVKEQINRAGEKIMPSELERILVESSDIEQAVVVGIPDEMLGNRICAFVVTDKADISLSWIRTYLDERGVASYKLPDSAVKIDMIPLTAIGKPDKKELVRMVQNNEQEMI